MKISALGSVLGALALGGVAVLYTKVDELSEEVQGLARQQSVAQRYRDTADERPSRLIADKSGMDRPIAPRPAAGTTDVAPDASDVDAEPMTLEERVARLERSAPKPAMRHSLPTRFSMPAFARSVDDLGKRLKLTPTQKDRVRAAVDRGKRRIEDIMKIPDADGKSPFERRKEQRQKIMDAVKKKEPGQSFFNLATGMNTYRSQPIPGRNTTYGEEIDRIKKETRDDVASALSTEQKKEFDDVNIDPMLGGGGGMQAISFFPAGDGAGGEEAGVVVEAGMTVIEDAEPEEKAAGDDE